MKNMKKINHKPILFLLTTSIFFMSCSKDDDVEYITQTITETVIQKEIETVTVEVPGPTVTVYVEVPYSYEFARAGIHLQKLKCLKCLMMVLDFQTLH